MLRLFILIVMFTMGCASPSDERNIRTTINFISNASVHETISLFESDGIIPEMSVRITYPDHESEVSIGGVSADEATEFILRSKKSQLEFLLTQFNSDDMREAPIYEALQYDLDDLVATDDLNVKWITLDGEVAIEDPLITSINSVEISTFEYENEDNSIGKSVYDYTGDASWVPAGGTSTIYISGSLQKFWMDADSADAFNSIRDGIEIDTLIKYRSYATCGSSVSSNMPDYYKDTEFGDGGSYRNCSVGTISANQLNEDTLYWTWFPFASFSSSNNPNIYVQFQASTWCSWVSTKSRCMLYGGAWCMCGVPRSDNPQWLIRYYYSDAPGVEKEWEKN